MKQSMRGDSSGSMVRVRGRPRQFISRCRVRRRDYYLLEQIGSPFRERYLAFDPLAGPGGDFFLVQSCPSGRTTEQQLRVWRRLKDDSFPRVVEWQQINGATTVVLTWVDGISLKEYFEHLRAGRRPPVDPGQAVRLIHGLANAVCKLHAKFRVAHGDIQPANVIITSHPSRLVLIDFGSAWTAEAAARREEGDGHHRCYAAPELQTNLTPVGFHADQFSVSVLLYELLTQQLPYGGLGGKAGRPEFIAQTKNSLAPPSQHSKACKSLPRSLRELIDSVAVRGLALDPAERFPDRHAWLDALFEVSARFRLAPETPAGASALTRVIEWFVKPKSSD
jgi:serine/threonine protein kinase